MPDILNFDIKTTHDLYDRNITMWQKNQDCRDGERAVKNSINQKIYLPPLSGHYTSNSQLDVNIYLRYIVYAVYFNATGRTVDGLRGMIFRKPPIYQIPEKIKFIDDNVDLKNQSLIDFVKCVTEQVIIKNRVGVLVDFPAVDTANMTLARYEQENIRPYLTLYNAEYILNWREEKINNIYQTAFVSLVEYTYESGISEFETQLVEILRILDFDENGYYRQRKYKRYEATSGTAGSPWEEVFSINPKVNGKKTKLIPFYCITKNGISWEIKPSVVNDLCDLNIAHYRNSASYENALILTGNPTPCLSGYISDDNETLTLGSSKALLFKDGGNSWFLQLGSDGLAAIEKAMSDKANQMALLGARIIAPEKRQVETAETASIHRAGEQSVLTDIAQSVSKSLEKIIKKIGEWVNLSEKQIEEIKFELNTDFLPASMSEGKLRELTKTWQSGGISDIEYFNQLKIGEIIDSSKSFEEHQLELEEQNNDNIVGIENDDAVEEEIEEQEEQNLENELEDDVGE